MGCLFSRCRRKYVINSLIHGHFHIDLVIILRPILALDSVSGQYGGLGIFETSHNFIQLHLLNGKRLFSMSYYSCSVQPFYILISKLIIFFLNKGYLSNVNTD
jgi:hypothetical protein